MAGSGRSGREGRSSRFECGTRGTPALSDAVSVSEPRQTANGPWGIEAVSNGGVNQGNAQQTVTLAPGTYQLKASAWANVFNDTVDANRSRARFRLLVDGVTIEQIDLIAASTAPTGWIGWTQLQTQTYILPVVSNVAVFMQLRADGTGGWG